MLDPGIHADKGYGPYDTGCEEDVWVQTADGKPYIGNFLLDDFWLVNYVSTIISKVMERLGDGKLARACCCTILQDPAKFISPFQFRMCCLYWMCSLIVLLVLRF